MRLIEITENGVFKLLSNLKAQKAAGPNLIPTQLLRTCTDHCTNAHKTLPSLNKSRHYTIRMERSKCGSNI
jgi:hypothetical protein